MSTAKLAWDTFMRVLAEISEANRIEAPADDIHELFQHANELLDIVDEEIENEPAEARADMRSAVGAMRSRLAALATSCARSGCAAAKAPHPAALRRLYKQPVKWGV